MQPEHSLPHSQQPATFLCPEPDQFIPHIYLRYILILFSHILVVGFPSGFILSGFPTKILHAFFLPYVPHVLPILFLVWSFGQYLVRNTDHEAPHFEIYTYCI